jgi:hypothetical protein
MLSKISLSHKGMHHMFSLIRKNKTKNNLLKVKGQLQGKRRGNRKGRGQKEEDSDGEDEYDQITWYHCVEES